MEWILKYYCQFDEGDDDIKGDHGYIYPPDGYDEPTIKKKGEYVWLIDDTNKKSMQLLAMFHFAVEAELGKARDKDYGDVSEDDIKAILKANKTLKTMEVTAEEIDNFMEHYSIYDYWPFSESENTHDYQFDIQLEPAHKILDGIDKDFLTRLWK